MGLKRGIRAPDLSSTCAMQQGHAEGPCRQTKCTPQRSPLTMLVETWFMHAHVLPKMIRSLSPGTRSSAHLRAQVAQARRVRRVILTVQFAVHARGSRCRSKRRLACPPGAAIATSQSPSSRRLGSGLQALGQSTIHAPTACVVCTPCRVYLQVLEQKEELLPKRPGVLFHLVLTQALGFGMVCQVQCLFPGWGSSPAVVCQV